MDFIDYSILKLLSDGKFYSGSFIINSLSLNITRAALSKRVDKLNSYLIDRSQSDLRINSVTGKGYSLNRKFDYLCTSQIMDNLSLISKERMSLDLNFFPVIESTNDYLLKNTIPQTGFTICYADQQLHGRGRSSYQVSTNMPKVWQSPFGSNIYLTMAKYYFGEQHGLLGLSLVIGMAVSEVLDNILAVYTDFKHTQLIEHRPTITIKWPNDIYINNKKVAGILTEIVGDPNGGCRLVLGLGLNIYNTQDKILSAILDDSIKQPWTTLEKVLQLQNFKFNQHSRNFIIAELINKIIYYFELFTSESCGLNSDFFMQKWQQYDMLANEWVNVHVHNKIQQGQVVNIDNHGALIINIAGVNQVFHSGEVSIRTV